ncbi:MAG: ABC transporter permease [Tenuifilaceae bacterium]
MSWLNLKLFLRNSAKDKIYVLINTLGLSIGIATVFLLFFWIMYEFNYDRFHKNYDNIYLVANEFKYSNGVVNNIMETPGQLAKHLQEKYPEIENATTCQKFFNRQYLLYGDKRFLEKGYAVQSSFFDILTFSFIKGDKITSLETSNSIVITERLAEKLFQNENPIGKKLKLQDEAEFIVTGILKDLPANSSIKFDFLLPLTYIEQKYNDINIWQSFGYTTYIQLNEKTDFATFSKKIEKLLSFINFGEVDVRLFLFPIKDFHFNSDFGLFVENPGDIKNTYILILLVIFILIISIINYVNLTIARSEHRKKEIGVKQALGVRRFQFIKQFYIESFILTGIVSLLSLLIVFLVIPKAQLITGKALVDSYINYLHVIGILGIIGFTAILAGFYPSFYLSSLKPSISVQNHFSKKSKMIKTGLVLFQFIIVMFVTISVVSIYTQVKYMMNKDLGYDKENLIRTNFDTSTGKANEIKNELLQNPDIKNVTQSGKFINLTMETGGWSWEGNTQDKLSAFKLEVGSDFTKTMKIDIIKGSSFSDNNESRLTEVMINQAAYKVMGINDCIGMIIKLKKKEYKVVGVIKDFHFSHLKFKIKPLILVYNDDNSMIIRLNGNNNSTIKYIESIYNKYNTSSNPFSYSFISNDIVALYGDERQMKNSISGFLVVLLLLSISAMMGMMASHISNKNKEIGLRKVFGAQGTNIIVFLLIDVIKLVLVAYIIAVPIAVVVINKWLAGFANHTEINIITYVLIGMFFIFFSSSVLLYQAYKASRVSPIKILGETS